MSYYRTPGASGGRRFDTKKKLAIWTSLEIMRLCDDLRECFNGEQMRLMSDVLLRPFLKHGGNASNLVEARIDRTRQLTDELYLNHLIRLWIAKDGHATCKKLYDAMVIIFPEDEVKQYRRLLGVDTD